MSTPQKIADGVYFLRMGSPRVQLNCVDTEDMWRTICNIRERDLSKLLEVDSSIISQAKEHCTEWFGKKLSDEFLENVYDSSLNDAGNLPVVLARSSDGKMLTRFFDETKTPSEGELSGPYDVIVELHGIQFIRKGYSPVWRILQVRERPKPKPEVPDQYMFQDDEE
jgi:hypothetical protein